MAALRILFCAAWIALAAYTATVIAGEGVDLLAVFFGDIGRMGWPGQFNLDFLMMLGLSALWIAWRERFTRLGLFLAALAFFGGAGFLLPYLIFASLRARGDPVRMLTGAPRR